MIIKSICKEIISEINNNQDSIFTKNIRKLDRSVNIHGQVNEISEFTLTKKERFNEIHEEYQSKYEKLEGLRKKLAELDAHEIESKEFENTLINRKNDLSRIRNELDLEYSYNATLKFILNRSRDLAKKAGIPINKKNEELFRLKLDTKKEKREIKQAQIEKDQLRKKIKKMQKELNIEKKEKDQALEFKLKIYEDQQRLKKCIGIEHKRHEVFEKNKQNIKKLQDFEMKIAILKQDNLINEELLKLNRHLENQERKFKAIQRVTYSSSIEDVLPYYLYLTNNRENLEKNLEQSLVLIFELNNEKKILVNELKNWQLHVEYITEDAITKERRAQCESEEKILFENEQEIEKLEDLVYTAANTLSRIAFQLGDEKVFDVDLHNITICLGFCCIKIDKIMGIIQSYQNVYYIESVNTDMQFLNPPQFLKLNSQIQNLNLKYSDSS